MLMGPFLVNFSITAWYLGWLFSAARECMRARFRGALAERAQQYTTRLLQIASLQTLLAIQALSQGIGPNDVGRNLAICTFSNSVAMSWIFSTLVFDAGETDPTKAARLRLPFRESAALVSSALYVLTGFMGYVVADQGDPNDATGQMVNIVSNFVILCAAVLTGRLVKDAKKKNTVRERRPTSKFAEA